MRPMISSRTTLLLAFILGCFTAVNQAACPAGSITFQTGSASVPTAWSAANQTAAGNTNSGALLPIATYGAELAGTGKNELWLYWKPVHPLLTVGAAVTADCAGGAAVRRLLQADTTTTSTATYTWSYTLDGQPAGGSSTPVSASTTPKITIQPWALNLANGKHSIVITATIQANSGAIRKTGDSSDTEAPGQAITITSGSVDFYFFGENSRPTAKINISSCGSESGVTITATGLTPPPAALPSGSALFLPVYYIYGKFVSNFDGSSSEGDDNTAGNIKQYGLYVTRALGSPNAFTIPNIAGLKEGYWNFTVEGALYSPVPSLMALSGGDTFGNVNVDYKLLRSDGVLDTFNMAGQLGTKFMGWELPGWKDTRVLLQTQPTQLTDFSGPDGGIQRGIPANFTWTMQGAGSTSCSIDGAAPRACSSPLTVTVNDNLLHKLTLNVFPECGENVSVPMNFSVGSGWATDFTFVSQQTGNLGGSTTNTTRTPTPQNGSGLTVVQWSLTLLLIALTALLQ